MKLTTVLIFLALFTASAKTFSQINLEERNVPLETVLQKIQTQTQYHFFYDADELKNIKLSVHVKNAPLLTALKMCFKDLPFAFKVLQDNVLIKRTSNDTEPKPITENKVTAVPVTVTGTVSDDKGQPLQGVTVKIRGANTAVITQSNGSYSIRVPDTRSVLVFTFVGFQTEEVPADKPVVNVTLKEQATGLNQVVVIGYGQVRKRDLTGAVGSVKVEDLQKAPVPSFDQALAGRVAGVQTSNTDGQPGGQGINIVIRGNNSLTGSNTPLYVIDGFPIENPDINAINPAEIETFDVLKDASATAVYGARGANGVIIINTKRGKKGDPEVSYNGYYGVATVPKPLDLLNPYQFVQLQAELNPNRVASDYFVNGYTLESYRDFPGAIDWQKELFQAAPYQNHFLSLSGGTDKTKYSLSGSFFNQKGVIIASGFRRAQGRFNLDQNVSSKIKVGINTNYSNSVRSGTIPRSQTAKGNNGNSERFNLLYNTWIYRQVAGRVASDNLLSDLLDPELSTGDYRINPLTSAKNEYNSDFVNNLNINGYLEYAISKALKLRITGGVNLFQSRNEIFNNTQTRSGSPLTIQGQTTGINGSLYNTEGNDYVNENSLTYNTTFGKNHQLNAVGIYSLQKNTTRGYGFAAGLLPNEGLGISGIDQGSTTNLSSYISTFTLQSFTGRVNYTFLRRYLFTATMRADGSSKFATGNKWGYFPSGAVAWRVSDEAFIKKASLVSNLKLRASYGLTGNNRVSDFGYLSQINTALNTGYPFGNAVQQIFYPSNLGNDQLKWESTGQLDIGADIGLWKDRFSLVVDYYKKQTYDLLLNANISPSTGFNSSVINIGKTSNEGLEATLSTVNIQGKTFRWTTDLNIAFNRNRIVALTSGENARFTFPSSFSDNWRTSAYISRLNYPITQFYGFVYDGVYQYNDFTRLPNGNYVINSSLPTTGGLVGTAARQPGDAKYKDLNGDGIVNDADQTVLGTPYPSHIGGLSNNFTYKNFDLNILFQWSYGNEILNANRIYLEGGGNGTLGYGTNQMASFANRWTPTNPNNEVPRLNSQGIVGVWSSRYIEDASYLRLKTLSLGYNIQARFMKRAHIKSLRVYGTAQNLILWTKYSGMDPEANTKGPGLTPAFDFSAYPNSRTVVFGLNFTL
ncbi:TonB-dependent receptor [Mucilaginibacter sp. PAMB04274]|uniref:SusC/RagA family TonB-linked outer membrane protein n=1 Tax=Mucilaginibacter sp. PAMB04274 TaxID=3138568 RepID=UPI0031F611B1